MITPLAPNNKLLQLIHTYVEARLDDAFNLDVNSHQPTQEKVKTARIGLEDYIQQKGYD